MPLTKFCVLVGLLQAAACSSGATGGSDSDRAAINELRGTFAAVYSAGDLERTTAMYDADAVLMPQYQPAISGRPAIKDYLKASFDQFHIALTLTSEEVTFMGEGWAYDFGRYSLSLQSRSGGRVTEDVGKYLVIWRKQDDGSWKLMRDIDNSSNPLHWDNK